MVKQKYKCVKCGRDVTDVSFRNFTKDGKWFWTSEFDDNGDIVDGAEVHGPFSYFDDWQVLDEQNVTR
jgi:hypothetical protein